MPGVREVVSVLCDDVLLQGVALREPLGAEGADEISPTFVDRLHVLFQTRRLQKRVLSFILDE